MPEPRTVGEVIEIVERHVDAAHRDALRSTTDPERGLPRFKTKAQQAQDDRTLRVLLRLLAEIHASGATMEQLQQASYARIDGAQLAADDTRLRRRLQGIPEVAPNLSSTPRDGDDPTPS